MKSFRPEIQHFQRKEALLVKKSSLREGGGREHVCPGWVERGEVAGRGGSCFRLLGLGAFWCLCGIYHSMQCRLIAASPGLRGPFGMCVSMWVRVVRTSSRSDQSGRSKRSWHLVTGLFSNGKRGEEAAGLVDIRRGHKAQVW